MSFLQPFLSPVHGRPGIIRLSNNVRPQEWEASRRWRWSVLAGALTIAGATLLAAALLTLELRGQAMRQGQEMVSALSEVTAEQMSQTLLAADLLLRSVQDLANAPQLPEPGALRGRATTRQFHDSLVRLQKLLPQIDAVGVLDADGAVIANSRGFPAPSPIDLSDTEPFRSLRLGTEQGLVVEGPVYARVNGRLMLYLGRAITAANGRFAGIAQLGIAIDYLEASLSTVAVGGDGSVALISDDARMIARWPKADGVIGQRVGGPSPPALAPDQAPRLASIVGVDGEPRVVADTRLRVPGVAMHVAVTKADAAILRSWRRTMLAIAAFAFIALAVLAFLVRFLLHWQLEEERWRGALLEREGDLKTQAAKLAAARDEAERAQRTRGIFFANMSHELRTPLNAVLGFSDCFQREIFGPLGDPRYREFANDIHNSGQHLLDMINTILDLSKIDSGKLELLEEDVYIAELMRFCGKVVADAARTSGVELDIRMPSPDFAVRADPVRMRQILLNLLSNAVKFTPAGGRVVVSGMRNGGQFVLRVADTGIGMTADQALKVLQPFYQVDNSITRRHQGTGLGLPLAKSLAELHGGRLEIESRPDAGTTVAVFLPINGSPESATAA